MQFFTTSLRITRYSSSSPLRIPLQAALNTSFAEAFFGSSAFFAASMCLLANSISAPRAACLTERLSSSMSVVRISIAAGSSIVFRASAVLRRIQADSLFALAIMSSSVPRALRFASACAAYSPTRRFSSSSDLRSASIAGAIFCR